MLRLVPPEAVLSKPEPRPDPRFSARVAVRRALESLDEGGDPRAHLDPLLAHHASLVDALLEDERLRHPEAVAALRTSLGLHQDPWSEMVERITSLDQDTVDPAERLRLAATLLVGEREGLPAAVTALCHHPKAGSLVAALHVVAHLGEQRRLLEGQLLRMRRNGLRVEPPFTLNRSSAAFHEAFADGQELVLVFREYPGVFTLFALQLGEGVQDLVIRPYRSQHDLREAMQARAPGRRANQSMDEARNLVAAAVARLGDRVPSGAWLALGHLVEERLFGAAGNPAGFVVGELGARVLVDRFARVVGEDEVELLEQMIAPASRADVALELFGVRYLRHVLGLRFGVARLDVSMEEVGSSRARAVVVGRARDGQVLTRTRLELIESVDGWLIEDIAVLGVGPDEQIYGPLWKRMSLPRPLPFRDYDALGEAEQDLVAGLLDEGHHLDEIAAAVLLLRDANVAEEPNTLAAAGHAAYTYAAGQPCHLPSLADRYGTEAVAVAMLLERITTQLELIPEDPRYAVES